MATATSKCRAQIDYELRDVELSVERETEQEKTLQLLRDVVKLVPLSLDAPLPDGQLVRRKLTEAAEHVKRLYATIQKDEDDAELAAELKLDERLAKIIDLVLDMERRIKTPGEVIAFVRENYRNGDLPE